MWEDAFQQKKKKPGLNFNAGLVMIGHQITAPCMSEPGYFNEFLE